MSVGGHPPFSNEIPRRRNRRGNPVPRRYVSIRPLVAYDPEALADCADAVSGDPEEAERRYVRLKGRNALEAMARAHRLSTSLYSAMEEGNAALRAEAAELEPARRQSLERSLEAEADAAAARSLLGLSGQAGSPALGFGEDEPASLEEIAGERGLPPPQRSPASKWTGRVVAAVGGSVLGTSLGLLVDRIELADLAREWPMLSVFCLVGWAVMLAVEMPLSALGEAVGAELYRTSLDCAKARLRLVWASIVLLASLAAACVAIDSRIERVGLLKSATEDAGLRAVSLERSDVAWASLILTVPAVSCFAVLGAIEGRRKANLCRLSAIRHGMRTALRADPAFRDACGKQAGAFLQAGLAEDALARLRDVQGRISERLPLEDRQRIEDSESDAMAHSWDAEDAIAASLGRRRLRSPHGRVVRALQRLLAARERRA